MDAHKNNGPRVNLRAESAKALNAISRDDLFSRFGVSRIGNITGLDCIGVPVYTGCRPAARTVSVNSGKSRDPVLARAGAVAEAVEFHTFENPPAAEFHVEQCVIGYDLLPIARGSEWTPDVPIPCEDVVRLDGGEPARFPSDLIWLNHRHDPVMCFQMTSNGQAVGPTFEDALLSGLCECVERDATTLRLHAWDLHGVLPPKVDLNNLPAPIWHLKEKIQAADLVLVMFYCTLDIPLPVYWAAIIDPYGGCCTFGGWGCDLNPAKAAERAVLEAIQSRAVYISGARDDILRRNYEALKAHDPFEQMELVDSIKPSHVITSYYSPDMTLADELEIVLGRLRDHKSNIYYKHLDLGEFQAVKTIILGLEPPRNSLWQPGKRSSTLAQACTEYIQNRSKASCGDLRPVKATSFEMSSIFPLEWLF